MFAPDRLTLGVFFPIEAFSGDRPTMLGQETLAAYAESHRFAALWFRDVPLRDPSFGDIGQIYDPWVYLGYITAQTKRIALATGAIVIPLRHPLHEAKSAASIDRLSNGRLVLGVASGDRPVEFPAFGFEMSRRGEDFREKLRVIRTALTEEFPVISSRWGELDGVDLVPKPIAQGVPILVTGSSQQSVDWIAQNADGWVMYPRGLRDQAERVRTWREAVARAGGGFKPFSQSLYIDLAANPHEAPVPIHLGFRLGREPLRDLLGTLAGMGVNHVILNLKYGRRPAGEVLAEIAENIVSDFPAHEIAAG
jgi:luciferase-type oxidoreductase